MLLALARKPRGLLGFPHVDCLGTLPSTAEGRENFHQILHWFSKIKPRSIETGPTPSGTDAASHRSTCQYFSAIVPFHNDNNCWSALLRDSAIPQGGREHGKLQLLFLSAVYRHTEPDGVVESQPVQAAMLHGQELVIEHCHGLAEILIILPHSRLATSKICNPLLLPPIQKPGYRSHHRSLQRLRIHVAAIDNLQQERLSRPHMGGAGSGCVRVEGRCRRTSAARGLRRASCQRPNTAAFCAAL
mmetsp:Transcript_11664/g.29321  ORF Transcript_11664/g.29321 Transcript_11664/m.29321 type:complete len:245 (-) Transcript_11664:278-1012(-)